METISNIIVIATVIILWARIYRLTKDNMALKEQIVWMSKMMEDPTSVQTLGVAASGGPITGIVVK